MGPRAVPWALTTAAITSFTKVHHDATLKRYETSGVGACLVSN